jgi:hypothetical protein
MAKIVPEVPVNAKICGVRAVALAAVRVCKAALLYQITKST